MSEKNRQQPDVVIYSSDSCTWCYRLKTYLSRNNIKFSEVNADADPLAAENFKSRYRPAGVPTTIIGNEAVVGFDIETIDDLLGLRK